jgi:hypothetical protein
MQCCVCKRNRKYSATSGDKRTCMDCVLLRSNSHSRRLRRMYRAITKHIYLNNMKPRFTRAEFDQWCYPAYNGLYTEWLNHSYSINTTPIVVTRVNNPCYLHELVLTTWEQTNDNHIKIIYNRLKNN